jgi:nucleoside phosphorylase
MSKSNVKVVILTNIEQEYFAVRSHLKKLKTVVSPNNETAYEVGMFPIRKYQNIEIAILKMGSGNSVAASCAERALAFFQPELMLLVGTAGAVRKVKKIGDVVIGVHAYDIQSGRDKDEYFAANPKMSYSSKLLINIAEQVMRREEWKKRSSDCLANQAVITGALASSEQVIESKSEGGTAARLYQRIRRHYASVVAVEMEGFGFLNALKDYNQVEKIIIKGISDKLYDKTEVNKQNSREPASANASAFAFELIHIYFQKKKPRFFWWWRIGIIGIIAIIFTVTALNIGQIFSFKSSSSSKKYIDTIQTAFDTIKSNNDIPEEKVIPSEVSKDNFQPIAPIENPIIPKEKIAINSFSIMNIDVRDTLLNRMKIPKNWQFKSVNAAYKIEITYSGHFEATGKNNWFRYKGGYVILKVNDETCQHFKELKIESSLRQGNSQKSLETHIEQTINGYILENKDFIISTIIECLNDYSS